MELLNKKEKPWFFSIKYESLSYNYYVKYYNSLPIQWKFLYKYN